MEHKDELPMVAVAEALAQAKAEGSAVLYFSGVQIQLTILPETDTLRSDK